MLKILKKIFGDKSEKDIKLILPIVDKINAEFAKLESLSNDELRAQTQELKAYIQEYIAPLRNECDDIKAQAEEEPDYDIKDQMFTQIDKLEKEIDEKIEEALKEILPRAFAIVKETARRFKENTEIPVTATQFDRDLATTEDFVDIEGDKAIYYNTWEAGGTEVTWDMVHYDVQLIGGVVLHEGKISEMATGEGKTLVATLPVFLNALSGRGVHLVTVNDYLARRDSEWMGPLYQFHGLSISCIDQFEPNSEERRQAYHSDITFGTNNEFGFDYLRDNMAMHPNDMVQRKHNFAIVDEVDSVLIDDARTPLIISGPVEKTGDELYEHFNTIVEKLYNEQRRYVTDILAEAKKLLNEDNLKDKNSKDTSKAREEGGLAVFRAFKGLPKNKALIKFMSEDGIKAQMIKTENFYLQDNQKQMPFATEPLFFVIDEKNNSIELTDKGHNYLANIVKDENFFILPNIGEKIAEIEKENLTPEEKAQKKEVLLADYSVKSERVHVTNQLLKAYALFEIDVEYVVMESKIKIVDEQTGRILEGRRYSDGLHQAIEAKENVKIEAATQTHATVTLQNYFRMYHKLAGMTGTAETEAKELWDIYKLDVVVIPTNRACVRKDKNDLVFKTKREKYKAVINEIKMLTDLGRPVLVGTTSVEVSELLSRMLTQNKVKHNVLNAKLHQREADIVAEAGKESIVTIATNMAGRGTDIKLSQSVKNAGGLAIIGTERHESRRVDRQLRGRAGRQGDPGSSQFFVSLEDDLMRMFGSERIAKIMDRLGLKEGDVIEHSMINTSIERAQRKVEENNFGIRKHLLEYDDVMNSQREVIYKKRRHALFGERVAVDISSMIFDTVSEICENAQSKGDFESFNFDLIKTFMIESPVDENQFKKTNLEDLSEIVYQAALESYKRKNEYIAQETFPVIKRVYETSSHQYKNIVIPITDGLRTWNIPVNLEEAYNSKGKAITKDFEKAIILSIIDEEWKENLREMDDLRVSVHNAVYEQKDPLLVYKLEAFGLFKGMIERVNHQALSILLKGKIAKEEENRDFNEAVEQRRERKRLQTSRENIYDQNPAQSENHQQEQKHEPVRVEKRVGRNDLCPCGSGKKYKNCHGINE